MKKVILFSISLFMLSSCSSKSQSATTSKNESTYVNNFTGDKVEKTQEEWQAQLSEKEYYVIRQKGTERAFTGDLLDEKREGTFTCKACQLPLFETNTKFKSGTGWPSFYEPVVEENIASETDYVVGYARTEVMCARCDGHLGHVFNDGPAPTGLRYCINSLSIGFEPKSETKEP